MRFCEIVVRVAKFLETGQLDRLLIRTGEHQYQDLRSLLSSRISLELSNVVSEVGKRSGRPYSK